MNKHFSGKTSQLHFVSKYGFDNKEAKNDCRAYGKDKPVETHEPVCTYLHQHLSAQSFVRFSREQIFSSSLFHSTSLYVARADSCPVFYQTS